MKTERIHVRLLSINDIPMTTKRELRIVEEKTGRKLALILTNSTARIVEDAFEVGEVAFEG